MPEQVLLDAAIVSDKSDLAYEPDDLVDDSASESADPDDADAPPPNPAANLGPDVINGAGSDAAAELAVACSHGVKEWTALDDTSIHYLRAAAEVYVFDVSDISSHPALLAAKARVAVASRKTVVYHTPEGVIRAIEPKSVKEALKSLQAEQWIVAIDL